MSELWLVEKQQRLTTFSSDVSKPCIGDLCYPEVDSIAIYLNSDSIREQLGIPEEIKKFQSCSNNVGRSYYQVGDHNYPTIGEVAALLNSTCTYGSQPSPTQKEKIKIFQ